MGQTSTDVDREAGARPAGVLYSFRRCPYAMRARLAIHSSGIVVELREIVLRDKAPEFLAASPKGTVPVLVLDDGSVIDESLDVMSWALASHDPENWLSPSPSGTDAMLDLIRSSDCDFKKHLDAYKYASRGEPGSGLVARQAGAEFLISLDSRLEQQEFLFGDRIRLADVAIFPFVRQFAFVDRDWFDLQAWPHLRRWLDDQLASARFGAVMTKYGKWQAGDEPRYFGGGINH
jgi:glutathione S-transferase